MYLQLSSNAHLRVIDVSFPNLHLNICYGGGTSADFWLHLLLYKQQQIRVSNELILLVRALIITEFKISMLIYLYEPTYFIHPISEEITISLEPAL